MATGPVVNDLLNANPGRYALLGAHVWDGYTQPASETRLASFYGSNWVPTMVTDGVTLYTDSQVGLWDDAIAARMALPTDVTIRQWAAEIGSQIYDVTAEVCIELGGTDKTVDVFMVLVLDHYPTTYSWYRNCLMQWAPTQQVTVAAGACESVTNAISIDATSWANQSDIRMIAWAQTPATAYPAEVHQADVMAWPFNDPPGSDDIFADGFESGDTLSWSAAVP